MKIKKLVPVKILIVLTLGIFILLGNCPARAANGSLEKLRETSEAFSDIVKKTSGAVVFITVEKTHTYRYRSPFEGSPFDDDFFERFFGRPGQGQPKKEPRERKYKSRGQGSGFIISDDGYIITNNHVVEGADKVTVKLVDKREFEAEVIGTDPGTDIAVIKIENDDELPYIELGDSDELEVGEWVLAIGNPFGLSHTVTAGIVSAKGRNRLGITEYEDFIQTDAAINRGNSGGPLIDLDGKVIGVNSAIVGGGSGGFVGIGFAIPVNMAKAIYTQLVEKGSVTRGFIGIYMEDLTPGLREGFDLEEDQTGILIAQVMEDSPADKAGLKHGDVIIKKDGQIIEDGGKFRQEISMIPPETEVVLTILRDGKEKDIKVVIGEKEDTELAIGADEEDQGKLGITVKNITDEIASQMNLDEDEGVIITEVDPMSNAADAGLSPGMVILEANRKPVENVKDFKKIIDKAVKDKDETILFYVKGKQISRYVPVKIDQ